MDIQIELPAVRASDLTLPPPKEASADVAARVAAAAACGRRSASRRLGCRSLRTNAEADGSLLEEIARPDAPGLKLLREAADAMNLSARGYHRVLRVARTLADLDGQRRHAPASISPRR